MICRLLPTQLKPYLLMQASKPFARGVDDSEREALFKERLRFGDPMAHLVRKQRAEQGNLEGGPEGSAALTERYDVQALEKSGESSPISHDA